MKMRKLIFAGIAGLSTLAIAAPAQAQNRYLGSLFLFLGNFCPRGSQPTSGQIMSIQQNTALFSLLGTAYGGNGTTTFGLPDLRGRAAIGQGSGPGLDIYVIGEVGGAESVSLNVTQIPLHTHTAQMRAVSGAPNTDNPTQASFGTFPTSAPIYNTGAAPSAAMAANTAGTMPVGSNLPIPVLSPYLTMQYCIFTTGIFPSRG